MDVEGVSWDVFGLVFGVLFVYDVVYVGVRVGISLVKTFGGRSCSFSLGL